MSTIIRFALKEEAAASFRKSARAKAPARRAAGN